MLTDVRYGDVCTPARPSRFTFVRLMDGISLNEFGGSFRASPNKALEGIGVAGSVYI
jgi:hypothetical protein